MEVTDRTLFVNYLFIYNSLTYYTGVGSRILALFFLGFRLK